MKPLPPPEIGVPPPPPDSVPEVSIELIESAQNNLVWSLLSMLVFVGTLIGGLALLYIREIDVPESFTTLIAAVTGAAMNQIGKVIESVSQLLVRRNSDNAST